MMTGSNYPKMMTEVIEAVHQTYVDNPEVEADCMVYLMRLAVTLGDTRAMLDLTAWFVEHDRCDICGGLMSHYSFQEPHPELDGCPVETITEPYCAACDGGSLY